MTRLRLRMRYTGRWRLAFVTDRFPEGMVYRCWCGPLLVKVMADRLTERQRTVMQQDVRHAMARLEDH